MDKKNIDTLKRESIRVYSGMTVVFPQFKQEETLDISELAKENGYYSKNNSTICYVTNNEVFVTPYTRCALRSLHSAGFCEKHFYVPFSNWDYPKNEETRWRLLLKKARKSYEDDFVEDCIDYCDKHRIGAIEEETLRKCFEMPFSGVKVKGMNYEEVIYPIVDYYFDSTVANLLGCFSTNNGIIVFLYRNGKTYVAKEEKIIQELYAAGYTKTDLFVPFSNGEQIQDNVLKTRWESIIR